MLTAPAAIKKTITMKRLLLSLVAAIAIAAHCATLDIDSRSRERDCCINIDSAASRELDSTALKRLAQFAGNMLTYNNNFTQEKVYLHLDNNGYIAGETIWFKAYVFKAASLLPTDMSKVLYVELLDPDGELVERKTLRVDNGRTYGEFELDPQIAHPGYYEVRAYTRAMLNWDQAYLYSRVLPIYAQPADSVNFTNMTLPYHEYDTNKRSTSRKEPTPLLPDGVQKSSDLRLTFYPEGGHITKGIASRVAFKITDKQGLPQDGKIIVRSAEGSVVADADILHDGMGVFQLPADWNGGSAIATDEEGKEHTFALPDPRPEGCDLQVGSSHEEGLDITIRSSSAYSGRPLGLSVSCRGTLLYFDTVNPQPEAHINLPYDKLRDGIAQITLFTDEGEVLSERLAWVQPHKPQPQMTIRQNQEVYQPFQPIVLDISLADSEGQPLQADFSLSVRDAATEVGRDECSLMSEMLLASDLKGYIHNPDYYFASDDEAHRQALDLLLMVQGWRRYEWTEMSGVKPFEPNQPFEAGLTLIGQLADTHAASKNLKLQGSLDINFLMQTLNGTRIFNVQTDDKGYFAVQMPDFNGDAPSVMTVTNKKDKRIYSTFKLDRNFSPGILPYEPQQVLEHVFIGAARTEAMSQQPDTFEWQDTIPDNISRLISLNEVTVKAKRPLGYTPGSRFTWMGGEDATRLSATRFYNLKEELDRYLDEGNNVPIVWEWLAERNPNLLYYPATNEMWYKGRRVIVLVDNNPIPYYTPINRWNDVNDDINIDKIHGRVNSATQSTFYEMNNFQSMSIVENEAVVNNIVQTAIQNATAGQFTPPGSVAIFLYTRTDLRQPNTYRRGTRWINIHGYSLCQDFYSPDYRQQDVPTQTDHRRTLYWAPDLITDTEGKANVIFYSGSRPDERLHINAQGIAVNGQMFEKK